MCQIGQEYPRLVAQKLKEGLDVRESDGKIISGFKINGKQENLLNQIKKMYVIKLHGNL